MVYLLSRNPAVTRFLFLPISAFALLLNCCMLDSFCALAEAFSLTFALVVCISGVVFSSVAPSAVAGSFSSSSSLGNHPHHASFMDSLFSSNYSSGRLSSFGKQRLAHQSSFNQSPSSLEGGQSFPSPSALFGSHKNKPSSSSSSLFGSFKKKPASSSSSSLFNASATTIHEDQPLMDLHRIMVNGTGDGSGRGGSGGGGNRRYLMIFTWVACAVLLCGMAATTAVLLTQKSDSSALPSGAGGSGESIAMSM